MPFLVNAKAGSIARARHSNCSARLNRSALQDLEDALGSALFRTGGRGALNRTSAAARCNTADPSSPWATNCWTICVTALRGKRWISGWALPKAYRNRWYRMIEPVLQLEENAADLP